MLFVSEEDKSVNMESSWEKHVLGVNYIKDDGGGVDGSVWKGTRATWQEKFRITNFQRVCPACIESTTRSSHCDLTAR